MCACHSLLALVLQASLLFAPATELCGCTNGSAVVWRPDASPLVYDLRHDITESSPLTPASWPKDSKASLSSVVAAANTARWVGHNACTVVLS